jgi:hypothetical protein
MSRRSNKSGESSVDMEVSNLFNLKNKNELTNALLSLRRKYPRDEDLVNKIQEVFVDKHSSIVKSAKKFAEAIRKRYSNTNIPYHSLLSKARAHAKKHHLTEAEFAEFQRIYEQEISGTSQRNEVVVPVTNLMKVLGNVTSIQDNYFNVNEADYRNLEEILKLYETSKPLHAQAMLQSMQYSDLDNNALVGVIDQARQNPGEHIHPVIAAMFLPAIKTVEHHFLYSNIAGVVKSRYNSEPLVTRPDYELFYNLVTDPNDVVCDSRTPVADLLHRCNLQSQLWNSVLHLRNGQYFNASFREFVTSVDVCRLNKYDNPDMIYGRNDGTILKRLLAAFSFRPTVVTTLPTAYVFANNPYAQNVRPTVTAIPMINVRLASWSNLAPSTSLFGGKTTKSASDIKLSETVTQVLPFIEDGRIVQRVSDVIYSREVLVFFVDRRSHVLTNVAQPFNLTRLPSAISGFERINGEKLDFESSIKVKEETFCLRSVVCADTTTVNNQEVVTSSSTILFAPYDRASGVFGCDKTGAFGADNIYHYDPMNALKRTGKAAIYQVDTKAINKSGATPTGKELPPALAGSVDPTKFATVDDAKLRCATHGIIFIYQNYKSEEAEKKLLTY